MNQMSRNISAIFKRELSGYFGSPVAYVFIVIFLLLTGFFTFYIGHFFELGQADLRPFFQWHPWIFLFLIPAVAMRLWAEERRLGTIELILTLPVRMSEVIAGKFLAAWVFYRYCPIVDVSPGHHRCLSGRPGFGCHLLWLYRQFFNGRCLFKRRVDDVGPHP